MEQNFKPMTKQLAIAAFILTSVTVLSLGIRQIRFSTHRANTLKSPVIADTGESTPVRPSYPEGQHQPRQPLGAGAEVDNYPADSLTVDVEPDPQHANASESDMEVLSDDHAEAQTDSGEQGKAVSTTKSFKGDYAKSEGKKGLEKISLSDHEDLYFSEKGEAWYVSKQPDGKVIKMQVQIDDTTGEFTAVSGGYYDKSEGSQDLHRIPIGDYEDVYITGEGEAWYVSEQPDGLTAKVKLQPE